MEILTHRSISNKASREPTFEESRRVEVFTKSRIWQQRMCVGFEPRGRDLNSCCVMNANSSCVKAGDTLVLVGDFNANAASRTLQATAAGSWNVLKGKKTIHDGTWRDGCAVSDLGQQDSMHTCFCFGSPVHLYATVDERVLTAEVQMPHALQQAMWPHLHHVCLGRIRCSCHVHQLPQSFTNAYHNGVPRRVGYRGLGGM